jgi:hypothetical protein
MKNVANGIDVKLLSTSSIYFHIAHYLPRFVIALVTELALCLFIFFEVALFLFS